MKQDIKERWLKALRSGEYKQGKGQLKDDDKYCCLGVLCDVIREDLNAQWVEKKGEKDIYRYKVGHYMPFVSGYILSADVAVFVETKQSPLIPLTELTSEELEYLYGHRDFDRLAKASITTISLADLNDKGISFERIAQLIEKVL